jgi:hypothetical protein
MPSVAKKKAALAPWNSAAFIPQGWPKASALKPLEISGFTALNTYSAAFSGSASLLSLEPVVSLGASPIKKGQFLNSHKKISPALNLIYTFLYKFPTFALN